MHWRDLGQLFIDRVTNAGASQSSSLALLSITLSVISHLRYFLQLFSFTISKMTTQGAYIVIGFDFISNLLLLTFIECEPLLF